MLERREFLVGCAAALLSVGAAPCGKSGNPGTDPDGPLDIGKEGFLQLRNESFRILDGTERVVYADLAAVEDGPVAPGLEQFTLRFQSDYSDWLEPGLYELYHTRMGGFHAYLDTQAEAAGPVYTSVFALLTEGS